ncbi:hypothetical protein B7P43_G12845 [Cryptotermes secundus]|uniref:HTH CENPB-type domain-containing protein n=2 Tax=Cryptotermes secundus TaxID=105785 RepID=A0A2J7Q5S1_9NEOP|nr:hypothetical protein B7P43_G12845 [Cryptotermes secundus]
MEEARSSEIPFVPVNNSRLVKPTYNKRVFTLSEKAALINCSETERLSVKELTERFKCGKTAVYEILKRKSEILEQCLLGAGSRKRKFRKTRNEEVNKAVWQWFVEAKSNNFNVTGPLLQAQAKLAAEHLGKTDFKASNGWLDSFRTRHSISFKQCSTESTQAYPVTHTEWDEYCEKREFVNMKKEQEDSETVDQQSSPALSRVDGDSNSSSPTTSSLPGPLLSVASRPETPSVPCTMLPSSVHQSIAESSEAATDRVLGVNLAEDEQTLRTLQSREREHQRRLEIMEKEHEIRLEILRIEKETAEINRNIARKRLLQLSEK